jgi:hypothetical protein
MDAHSRRQGALDAIANVVAGATAGDAETEVVDFKQEAGTIMRGGQRVAIGTEHEPAAQALAAEVACMAMSEAGGVIVVGVNDKAAGPEAFVGSYLDLGWLRRRVYALTQPNFSIDIPEELTVEGKRLYLINVAPALGEIRSGGKLRTRFGTDCVELDGDRARKFLEQRRNYDWSAEPSPERLNRTMLRDGHSPPDITVSGGDVVCRLPGGCVDEDVRGFFDALARTDSRFDEDVRSHIAITELLNRTPLRAEGLASAAQCSEEEAFEVLRRLAEAGALERLLNGSRSFRLTTTARAALDSRIKYKKRSARDQRSELVRAYLDVNEDIGRAEAASLLGVGETRASAILSDLYNKHGMIKPLGAARGRGVRYTLAK